ncbi:MAG: hypothetical protein ACREP2_00875 [Rhodanobacteraceae bacterium]
MTGKKKAQARSTAGAVRKQREIRSRMERRDQEDDGNGGRKKPGAVQAGARRLPAELPAQRLRNPG